MGKGKPESGRQGRLLRAKIAAGNAAKAAADSALGDMQRALTALVSEHFLTPGARCRIMRRAGVVEDLKAAARTAPGLWRLGPVERPAIVGFDERLIVAAADIAIARTLSAGDGAPTALDRAVAATFARRLALLIAPYTDDSADPHAQSGPIDDLLSKDSPPDWMVYSILLDLGPAGDALTAFVAVPAARIADADVPIGVEALRRRFSSLPVAARCIAGGFEAPLSRLLRLAPGETFAIEWRGNGAAPLMVGNREFSVGSLGEHDGRRAIKIAAA